jgi:hypothetical protein
MALPGGGSTVSVAVSPFGAAARPAAADTHIGGPAGRLVPCFAPVPVPSAERGRESLAALSKERLEYGMVLHGRRPVGSRRNRADGAAESPSVAPSGHSPGVFNAPVRLVEPLQEPHVFRNEGEYWTIIYAGQVVRIRSIVGLRHLAQLVWHPQREFHVLDLMRAVATTDSRRGRPPSRSWGTANDARAVSDYRRRVQELEEERAEAQSLHDLSRVQRVCIELEVLVRELRSRTRGGHVVIEAERARVAVSKGLTAALGRIRSMHAALAAHLEATVKRGYVCVYRPDPRVPVRWEC